MLAFYMHDMSWGWGIVMMLGWIAVWALIIWAVVGIWRGSNRSARDVLDRRLAAGEISVEEYTSLRDALSRKGAGTAAPS